MVVAAMSVVYVLTTPILEDGENATVDQIRKRNKWDNNDYDLFCYSSPLKIDFYGLGLILKGMSDPLIDIYQNVKSGKEIWYSLEAKYLIDCINIEESLRALDSDKPKGNNVVGPQWLNIVNDNIALAFMLTYKLNDSILWHARLGHVHFKRMQNMFKDGLIPSFDMDTEKYNTCKLTKISKKPFQNIKRETKVLELIHSDLCDLHATPSLGNKKYFVTFIDDASRFCYVYLLHTKDEALDKFKVFKTKVELQQGSLIKRFRTDRGGEYMDTLYFQSVGIIHEMTAPYTPQQNGISERKNRVLKEMVNSMLSYSGLSQGAVVRLPDPKLKTLGERGIECIFVGYAEHSKAFRFYVIEPNDSVSINSIIESRDAIFNENKFSSASRPSLSIPKGTENISGSVVPEEVTDEYHKTADCYGINSQSDYSSDGCEDNFLKWLTIGLTKEFLSSRFSMKDMGEADVILGIRIKHESNGIAISQSHYIEKVLKKFNYFDCTPVSTPMDTSEKLMPNNGQAVSQLEYSRVIGCLMYAMTCTRPDIAFAVGKLSMYTSNLGTQHWQAIQRVLKYLKKTMDYSLTYTGYPSVLEGYTDANWISNTEDNSSTSGWVFLLGGASGKEAECVVTLTKVYSQMYNEKSRHLGVRQSMIRELIMNGVVSIEFVRSQRNLADHLTKGLAKDLVLQSAEWMSLKSN
ncbi:zinc finger, CCHC-type containing protein [Tanacetum coccineum]